MGGLGVPLVGDDSFMLMIELREIFAACDALLLRDRCDEVDTDMLLEFLEREWVFFLIAGFEDWVEISCCTLSGTVLTVLFKGIPTGWTGVSYTEECLVLATK